MRIWIDLANSPQVLFFRPLIPEIKKLGHEITVTSRHFAQTVELADYFGLDHIPIGGHGGEKLNKIGAAILERSWKLYLFAWNKKFEMAISHNSYAQALAAKALRIPFVTSMDYEYQPANHLCFRLARKVVVPEFFPDEELKRFGVTNKKLARYPGTKEEVYLSDFTPQMEFLGALNIPKEKILVIMRPPGTWALYHHFENPLFDLALEHVAGRSDTQIIFLPRIASQADSVDGLGYTNVYIPPRAMDGPNLMYHADIVISGGGSMNREAAVLGTPTYSLFKGKLAAVDRYLIEQGRLKHINSADQIKNIPICKKNGEMAKLTGPNNLIQQLARLLTDV